MTENRPPILVYHHVPKTAGTAMRAWLREVFGHERVFWHGEEEDGFIEDVLRERGVEHFSRFAAIGGHIFFTNPCIQALPQSKIFAAVFRNPAEQLVSHFEYISKRPEHHLYFDGSLEKALRARGVFWRASRNMQCRYSTGNRHKGEALRVFSQNRFILGCFDNLPKFVDCIAANLDVPRGEFPRLNVQGTEYFDKHYSPGVARRIRRITRADEAIYRFVLKEGIWSSVSPHAKPLRSGWRRVWTN